MREVDLVRGIRQLAESQPRNKAILRGVGDDCAVIRPPAKQDLVFTTDFVIEDRHFTLATHKAADVGHKALARSLSDLAAMGAKPLFCLVSLATRAELGKAWVDGFYSGLLKLAEEFQVTLAGGDLASAEKVTADVMCCGVVPPGKALLRSGARRGDHIYVTGELGGSALGLKRQRGSAWKRHLRPQPRVKVGLALRKLDVRSCMDVSDGLSLDLKRLCLESKVSARLTGALPMSKGASLEQALHGGEDYELIFTTPERMPARIAGVAITDIGEIVSGSPGAVLWKGELLPPGGFDHFVK
ncbi:MAG: thiamine-phosphate kinase [Bryobacteraceae bacterium]